MRPGTRVRIAALVLAALGILLLGYCARRPAMTPSAADSGPVSHGTGQGTAGATRSGSEAVRPPALPPHRIRCGLSVCSGQEVCCLGQVPTCMAPAEGCPRGALRMECDDRTDCPVGEVCCGKAGRYACATKCLHISWQLCSTDSECATGKCFRGSCAVATGGTQLQLPVTRSTASVVPHSATTSGNAIARPPATAPPLPRATSSTWPR